MITIVSVIVFTLVLGATGAPWDDRIVNGTNAADGEIPYIVSLQLEGVGHSCGASIINSQWVLTAAHCVYQGSPSVFSVLYGTLSSLPNKCRTISVKTIVIHPEYQHDESLGVPNDIALLQLAVPLTFSQTVQPVSLPSSDTAVPVGASAVLAGWGELIYNEDNAVAAEHLQRVDLIVYSDEECEVLHPFDPPMLTNSQYHLCAGAPEGGKGQCRGDSGGPLVLNGEQIGIVSFSQKPCGIKGYPGVFTKVAHYVKWIADVVAA